MEKVSGESKIDHIKVRIFPCVLPAGEAIQVTKLLTQVCMCPLGCVCGRGCWTDVFYSLINIRKDCSYWRSWTKGTISHWMWTVPIQSHTLTHTDLFKKLPPTLPAGNWWGFAVVSTVHTTDPCTWALWTPQSHTPINICWQAHTGTHLPQMDSTSDCSVSVGVKRSVWIHFEMRNKLWDITYQPQNKFKDLFGLNTLEIPANY